MSNQDLSREMREELKMKFKQLDDIKKLIIKNSKNNEDTSFLLKRLLKNPQKI